MNQARPENSLLRVPALRRARAKLGFFLLILAGALGAQAQSPLQLKNDFRNEFRLAPGSGGTVVYPPSAPNDLPSQGGNSVTAGQFKSGTAFGGWRTTRILGSGGEVLAGSASSTAGAAGTLTYPHNANLRVVGVSMARTLVFNAVSLPLGSVIPPPSYAPDGQTIAPPGYYLSVPANAQVNDPANSGSTIPNPDFYYSRHSRQVYATQPGQVSIIWTVNNGTGLITNTQTYVISTSPVRPPQTIFWTEGTFNGPLVETPVRVADVQVIYNRLFTKIAASPYISPTESAPPPTRETKTLWWDSTQKSLRAYNLTGRCFVEYLGASQGDAKDPLARQQLGFEIVDVRQDVAASRLTVALGDKLFPVADVRDPDTGVVTLDSDLVPEAVAGTEFLYRKTNLAGTYQTYYAKKQALSGTTGDQVLIYWMQAGLLDVRWPRQYVGYNLDWPASDPANVAKFYSIYARPDSSTTEGAAASKATGVPLDSNNVPSLVYQDDPLGKQAVLAPGNIFYTNVTAADPTNRALILYDNQTDVWFERVFSELDTHNLGRTQLTGALTGGTLSTGFTSITDVVVTDPVTGLTYVLGTDYTVNSLTGVITAVTGGGLGPNVTVSFNHSIANLPIVYKEVGQRIEPTIADAEPIVGYIWQGTGTAFNPQAYLDPFVVGFDAAAKGAIIGVNALPGQNELEVWWYKKSHPPVGSGFTGTPWPQFVERYQLAWPTNPDPIVLASNAGSGDLNSLQGAGKIYYQNDSSQPGFNPNEEHALITAGRAWALRDDLNIATSSQPYVLLAYTDADARPNMRVFKVLREDATHDFSRIPETAGVALQRPLPLTVLPLPIKANGAVQNYEVDPTAYPDDPLPAFNAVRDAGYERYRAFTYTDRKGTAWIYRGPHGGNPVTPATGPTFSMRYFYYTQVGFYFPTKGFNNQPAVGTITPFLRPYLVAGNPASGFALDPVTGAVAGAAPGSAPSALNITYAPVWPDAVPELNVAETLTLPKAGLPQVRGASSVQLIYQQSIAQAMDVKKPSARLHDPTVAKKSKLATGTGHLAVIPGSVKTSTLLGKTYFPNLPPHLIQRFYFDPADGSKGSLVLKGTFQNDLVGEKYLLLNVLGSADIATLKGLCSDTDLKKADWDREIAGLNVTVSTFKEDPNQRGTFIVDSTKDRVVGVGELVEVASQETAHDSYAVTGDGGGTGYVVMVTEDGRAFTPEGNQPAVSIFKVGYPPLYRGQLKALLPSNPLDDQVTVQHTGDFAGHPENYEFQWIYTSAVGGVAPEIQTKSALTVVGAEVAGSRDWSKFNNPQADLAKYRVLTLADASVIASATPYVLGQPLVINNGAGSSAHGSTLPNALLRKNFNVPSLSGGTLLNVLVSLDLGAHEGANVYLNGALVATWNVPGQANSTTTLAPAVSSGNTSLIPLPLVFEAPTAVLRTGTNANALTIELFTNSDAGASSTVNARVETVVGQDAAYPPNPSWTVLDPQAVTGKSRHLIHGPGLLTLGDYFYSMRYRALRTDSAAYNASGGGWSPWVEPQSVEGWIKRALKGINPFNQRISDLFNNPVDTGVSLVQQAGTRWEGDISLSLDNINDVGLIEIYETILNHGRDLSINGGFNDPGANSALVLAAGYLRDLYMVLGNEAFADAANPTIAFSTESAPNFVTQYGDVATSLFAFKGQAASLMDEELGLLRGRDDLLPPKNRTAPVYNRLFWNYTRGIDSGEAVYALNYNIKDVAWDYTINASNPTNAVNDGVISAADAATLYPQGHGDAYGHYLTALTGYYELLANANYSWVPRTEAVSVLGQDVLVGYLHERKFAGTAAALARTSSQILDLTYRKAFTSSSSLGWTNLRDAREAAGRNWGADDWACRGGQGAYFNWVTGNSLLPDVDPDPSHEGIQKIDRTTVSEFAEVVAQATAIQKTLDNADERLNPLGLSRGTLSFDISPAEVDAGKTHFEQIYGRAVVALQNAVSAFNNAKGSTQFLRQQEDTLEGRRNAIDAQEQAYTNQLVDLYGTPYTDDIGPGKTYAQDYAGPDFLHSAYVEIPEVFFGGLYGVNAEPTTYSLPLPPSISGAASDISAPTLNGSATTFSYTINAYGLPQKPSGWTGRRVRPGQIQADVSGLLAARGQLVSAIKDYTLAGDDLTSNLTLAQAYYSAHSDELDERFSHGVAIGTLQAVIGALQIVEAVYAGTAQTSLLLADAASEGFPHVIGLANDATSIGRASVKLAGIAGWEAAGAVAGASKLTQGILAAAVAITQADLDSKLRGLAWDTSEAQMLFNLKSALNRQLGKQSAIDAALRNIDDATRRLQTTVAQGDRILAERTTFRQQSAAIIQGYRTRDFAFRAFRDEALEKYKTLFDLAARYTFLASRAYDYETGLLDPANSTAGSFFDKIVAARSLGVVSNGQPQFAGSTTGDPGLSGILAQMNGDWSVVKTRLGFNNPDRYRTDFSLRQEQYRILPGTEGDQAWQDKLGKAQMTNILDDPDVRRYCLQPGDVNGLAVPGFVIPFQTTIAAGYNFFGLPLAGGDHSFSPTSFATKIRSSGIAFKGYVGMDSPTTTSGTLADIGATSPSSPSTGFSDPQGLSATPYIYLIPAGVDSMRSPPLGDTSTVRTWQVEDQAIPLPFNIGNSAYSTIAAWTSAESLSEPAFAIRKHQAFRAVPTGVNFPSDPGFSNARLIGRSVWNSQWKIVIPGNTLLNDPAAGVQIFSNTVKDIKIHLESYSYSGN